MAIRLWPNTDFDHTDELDSTVVSSDDGHSYILIAFIASLLVNQYTK